MHKFFRGFYSASGLLCLLLTLGCSANKDPLNRQAVSGQVTFQGQPLDYGSIAFEAMESTASINSGASIENGKFAISEKRGLPPGEYTVRISGPDLSSMEVPVEFVPGVTRSVAKERIPAAWNSRSKQKVSVVDGGGNSFEFLIP